LIKCQFVPELWSRLGSHITMGWREVTTRLNFWSGEHFSVPRLARDALNVQQWNLEWI
jgi:hypothetical protein